jgi:hypothetical protein
MRSTWSSLFLAAAVAAGTARGKNAFIPAILNPRGCASDSIDAAAQVPATSSNSSAPLFDSTETVQLTNASLQNVVENNQLNASEASLFDFADGELVNLAERGLIARTYGSCKTAPGDTWWPSKLVWNIFDLLLGGALVKPPPIGAVCFKDPFGVYNAKSCSNVIDNWSDSSLQCVSSFSVPLTTNLQAASWR